MKIKFQDLMKINYKISLPERQNKLMNNLKRTCKTKGNKLAKTP